MPSLRLRLCATLLLLTCAAGCSATHQIQTAPPRPATAPAAPQEATEGRALLRVALTSGETPLPDDVEALRFRVADVRLRSTDGAWETLPADANVFELRRRGARLPKELLSTHLPPLAYDSLALTLTDVYVTFGPDAGGPLTAPRAVRLAFPMHPAAGSTTDLQLLLEPGASLTRTDDCRWLFLPFLSAHTNEPGS